MQLYRVVWNFSALVEMCQVNSVVRLHITIVRCVASIIRTSGILIWGMGYAGYTSREICNKKAEIACKNNSTEVEQFFQVGNKFSSP